MKRRRWWQRPNVAHAARVAVTATLVIVAMYVCVVVGFDVVDRHRLVAQIDARLDQRLGQMTQNPAVAASTADFDNAHDVDDSPVFVWSVDATGAARALTPGAPVLARAAVPPVGDSVVARLGTQDFRLQNRRVGGRILVAGQSLAEVDHVLSDVIALEVVAGPVLLLAVFFGTVLIGIKAAAPVELSRRRQLEFTADASHELRTPLSVMEAEISLALSGRRSAGEYRDTLGRVGGEALRLRDIVEDLLWLSRFDAEPPPPGDQPVDVSSIAHACADRFDGVAQSGGIALSVVAQGQGQPWINAPPEWVDRLTAVLVDNACRYAGSGGTVQITVSVQGNRVSLAVEDDGPGIAPEERASLFDRFHRATDEGNGAGLGLAIADAVVRATNGEWQVTDSSLGGAHMEVRWPRSQGAGGMSVQDEPVPSGRAGQTETTSASAHG